MFQIEQFQNLHFGMVYRWKAKLSRPHKYPQ